MSRLFVSHATEDKALVQALIDLLRLGVGVSHADIFSSSSKGHDVRTGEHFPTYIREMLGGAQCVIAVISEAYYASPFCMCELGGVWLEGGKTFIPLLAPPYGFGDLKAVLRDVQALKLEQTSALDTLNDDVLRALQIPGHGAANWNLRRDDFLTKLPDILKGLTFEGPVPRAEHDKVMADRDLYKAECSRLMTEGDRKDRIIEALKKAKDATEGAAVIAANSTFMEQFEQLVTAAARAIKELPDVVREALYHQEISEEYRPTRDDLDAVTSAVQRGLLKHSFGDDHVLVLDEENPDVEEADRALHRLRTWLKSAPDDFDRWYRTEYRDRPKLSLRPFWERHF